MAQTHYETNAHNQQVPNPPNRGRQAAYDGYTPHSGAPARQTAEQFGGVSTD